MDDLISRAEAIKVASGYCHWTNIPDELAKLPSVNPIPCEDAISRQAVMELLHNETEEIRITSEGRTTIHVAEINVEELERLPFITHTEKVGCWVEIDDEPHEVWECDHCGFVIDGSGCIDPYEYRDTYKYCPNCGAKMGAEE